MIYLLRLNDNNMASENDIYELAVQFENDLAEAYGGDEFYERAVRILSENGYSIEHESIFEVQEEDPQDVEQYLEVIGEFEDAGNVPSYLSFVLEDSRDEDFRPSVEFVSGLDDFSFKQ